MEKIFKSIINNEDTVFDIGANIGDKTAVILNFCKKVICVEPQQKCIFELEKKFKNNPKVSIVGKGCGAESKIETMYISSSHTLSTMSKEFVDETKKERFQNERWDSEIVVPITTLDILISEHGLPAFCKIDIEGYELEALKGLSYPIKTISIEFTPELKSNTFKCIDLLTNLNKKYKFNYSSGESGVFYFEKWISKSEMIDFLAKDNDFKVSFGDLYVSE